MKKSTNKRTQLSHGDLYKFIGLLVFIVFMLALVALLWPYLHGLFEMGGFEGIIHEVRSLGPLGALMVLGLQFLQIVVAFIPGEVVQLAAGMLYGPWLGALVIVVGCVISSAFIFMLVHRLGAPFVQALVPTHYLDKFRKFELSGKLTVVVFVLFLIPGLPKDVFTYLVPLTDMRMRTFLLVSNIARIPGILVSTYAAAGLVGGRVGESVIIFVGAALLAVIGIALRRRIMHAMEKGTKGNKEVLRKK